MVLELCENNQKRLCANLVKKYRFLLGAIQNFHQTVAVSLDNRDFTILDFIFILEKYRDSFEESLYMFREYKILSVWIHYS